MREDVESLVKFAKAIETLALAVQNEIDRLTKLIIDHGNITLSVENHWKPRLEFLEDFLVRLQELTFPNTTIYGQRGLLTEKGAEFFRRGKENV